jgi:hypothetical protein
MGRLKAIPRVRPCPLRANQHAGFSIVQKQSYVRGVHMQYMHLGGFMFKVIKKVVIISYLLLLAFLLLDKPKFDLHRGVNCDVPQVVVQKDDTLWDIAVRHCGGQRNGDIKVGVIKDLNQDQDVVNIDVGMVILMPHKSVAK